MFEAALFGAISQSALIAGALLVWWFPKLKRPVIVGSLMAFGAGAVISAVAVDLVSVSYAEAGAGATAVGIGIGCLLYFGIVALLERRGQTQQPHEVLEEVPVQEPDPAPAHGATKAQARNLMVGMVIDGVPESVAIGLTLHTGGLGISAALVGSIFIASIPEAIGIAAAMLAGGLMMGRILLRFAIIVAIGAVSAAVGYSLLFGASDATQALIQSIAAGALLVVVINEMIPIAVRSVKAWAGVIGAAGFVFSALLTWAANG